MKRILAVVSISMILFATVGFTQEIDFCVGDFDYDGDCDGTDASIFKLDFGRSVLNNHCPPDGPAPVTKTGQTTSLRTGDDGQH